MALIQITDEAACATEPAPTITPLWRLGFRPFYLLGAAFAVIAIPMWMAKYYGHMPGLNNVNFNWHMHEMVFGFAVAIVVGFLYTAGRNWTNLWTPRGKALAALAGLWLAGRVAMLFAGPLPAALVDMAFLPVAAWLLYQVLKKAPSKRNLVMVGLLGLLAIANAGFHASVLGWMEISTITSIHAAIFVIVMIESIIGGRVIPLFTGKFIPGAQLGLSARMDRLVALSTILACLGWIAGLPGPVAAILALAAAALQTMRLISWKSWHTLNNPLLWILHLSYAWIPVGFVLLALASLDMVSSSAGIHALAAGSIAGLILGMITRTALGHTARPLKAGKRELVMYVLIQFGAVARLLAAIGSVELRDAMLLLSTASWSAAFLLYVWVYLPYLTSPRLDNKDG